MSKYKFLMVEDQPVDSEMAVRALKKNNIDFEFIRVETESSFITALNEFNPDIIISDYSMPMFDGMRALKLAKEIRPELPFIVLTGSINEETAVECMKAGANDYILKDNMTRLPYAVIDAIKNFENQKQKQLVELSLDESEKRYKALFQNNHAVMLLVNPENGQIVDANPAACGFYGWSHEELVKMSMHDFSKLTKDELANIFIKAMSEETSMFLMEHSIANGQKRFVDVYSGPINVSGKSLLYSIIHDVTDRVIAENALKKSEAEMKLSAKKWQDTFNSITDIVCVISLDHTFIEINEAGCKSLNLKHEQIIGKRCFELVHGTQSPLSTCPCSLSIKSGEPSSSELEQNGNFYETTAWPIFDDKNNMIAFSHSIKDITERRIAEDARIKSEAKYKFMFNYNPQPMWIYDLETLSFLEINEAAVNHYGYSKEEFLSMTLKDIRPKEDIPLLIKDIENTKDSYNPAREWRHQKKNGEIIIVEISSHSILFNNREARHVLVNDITLRKKTEDENRTLAHAIKSINDCVSVTDLDNNITFMNDSFIKTYGYKWDELFGKKIDMVWSLKNPVGVHAKVIEETMNGSFQGEMWNKRKDGSEFQITLSTSPIYDEKGKISALVGISNDISKRKFDENVQHILHEIARTFLTNITIEDLLILVRNELSKVIDTSNFFVATYNSETEILKKVIFIDEKDDFIEWKAENSLSGQVVKEGKTLLINEDQRNIFAVEHKLDLKGTPAKSWLGVPIIVNKKPTGVIVLQSYTNKDAFDRSSAQLLELIAHEIAIVFERKEMILHLIEAKEKAEESDRLKTAFLANISHEIRTPMNGILGFSDMLARDNLDIEKREMFIEIIRKSGNQLLSIIDDIIDISKIETEQIRVEKEIFDLNEVMDYTLELFKPQFDQLNLEFEYIPDCKNKTCIVESDKVRIQQIITNLLNNALKFTHSGFVKFGYTVENNVKIFVKDSGIGIAPEHENIVFERFRQVDEGSSRNYGGTGLGLSISKALVEKLGGTIWFESVPNEGSTFYFTIPAKIFDSNLENPDIELLSKNEILLNNEITILIVDDEKMNYLYLKEIIDFLNIKNIYASNGMEAIELVEKHPEISLILMDIKMPVMNGYISTKKIKKLRPKLPIIAQTAYAQQGDREKAINAGCDDYISKPIKEKELISLIKKVLNK